jgi:hypothetical protein
MRHANENNNENPREFLMRAVPRCMESFFPDGKILPHHIPEWMACAVKVKLLSGPNDVDLDVNIPLFKSILFKRGLELLEEKRYEEGRSMFAGFLTLTPPGHKAPLARYNLACAEALLGRSDLAVDELARAVDDGYRNLGHMVCDSDLDSLREHPGYMLIVKQLTEMHTGHHNNVNNVNNSNNNNNTEVNVEEPPKQQPQPQEEEIKKEEEVKKEEIKEEPKKEEEIKEEPKKEEESADEAKFKTELQLLNDMGFVDRQRNLALLLAESGDLANVIHHLFS